MGALLAQGVTCSCAYGYHPQVPPKDGQKSYHRCGTCGSEWPYGSPAPVCKGAPEPEAVA